jgi:hypothetical protein
MASTWSKIIFFFLIDQVFLVRRISIDSTIICRWILIKKLRLTLWLISSQ